ncbi:glutathione peroxidase [Candidatus Peregrinibacteria bacterium]|nr:MAG: glutathione peroxidase [Candidatus Peregrinibacteria bacterium]
MKTEGQNIPAVTFRTRENGDWKNVSTSDIFDNKTVIVFSLPGAFTPTCSSSHVPRYNELYETFMKNGVDEIVCMSVNDTFVMNEWKKDQDAEKILFIPDGNGEFTEGMGQLVDKSDLGFGKRSWRYSMLVKNGKIEKMFVEPQKEGDPFEVSDAETMLQYINADEKLPLDIFMVTKKGCSHCQSAKDLLESKGLSFEESELNTDISPRALRALTSQSSTPQVFIEGKYIGGNDELTKYFS